MTTNCERYQAQLLDHLYDLLEPADKLALEGHLAECAPCQEALRQAEEQRQLIAAAAKTEFKSVRFEPPAERKTIPLMQPASRAGRAWVPWSMAAAILLLIAAGGVPSALYLKGWSEHAQEVARFNGEQKSLQGRREQVLAAVTEQSKKLEQLQAKANEAVETYNNNFAKAQQEVLEKYVVISAVSPQTYEPGAPNNLYVWTTDVWSQPADATVKARVLDDQKKVVAEATVEKLAEGQFQVSLPRDLAVKPNSYPMVEICARNALGMESKLAEPLQLATPVYFTHIATDKPMYLPGERVFFRSLTLDRFSLKPAALPNNEPLRLQYTITNGRQEVQAQLAGIDQINDAKGQPILGPDKKPVRGLGAGEWQIPPDAAGGEYTVTISEQLNRFPAQQRKFIVNKYEKPRLKKELEYTRKSYGPGDEVVAACKVSPAEGGSSVANQPVEATVLIDGKSYGADGKEGGKFNLKTDAAGAVSVRFSLPKEIERGEASLSVIFTDGGSTETLVRPIPIVLKKLNVELFPEGGDLVAGVPNRCYFQARSTLGKPAELTARLADDKGNLIQHEGKPVTLQTLNDAEQPGANQGMGAFTFIPEKGKKYRLQAEQPTGVTLVHEFPAVKSDGVVLHVAKGVLSDKDPITVELHSKGADRRLLVGAYCRGRLLDQKLVTAKNGEPTAAELKDGRGVGGVYRVTVFQEIAQSHQWQPVAERLIYRAPAEKLNLKVEPGRKKYMPGERATMLCDATDESGKPAPSVLMVAVVDKNVLTLADEKTHRVMPTHFFLTQEVKKPEDLEHTDFLLTDHPKAPIALDLLLGTQGWRRFAEQNLGEFQEKQGEEAERFLAQTNQQLLKPASNINGIAPVVNNEINIAIAKMSEEYNKQLALANQQVTEAQNQLTTLRTEPKLNQELNELEKQRLALKRDRDNAQLQLDSFNEQWGLIGTAWTGVVLLGLALFTGGLGMSRSGPGRMPYLTTSICALLAIGLGSVWVLTGGLDPGGQQEVADASGARKTLLGHAIAPDMAEPALPEERPAAEDAPLAAKELGARKAPAPDNAVLQRGGIDPNANRPHDADGAGKAEGEKLGLRGDRLDKYKLEKKEAEAKGKDWAKEAKDAKQLAEGLKDLPLLQEEVRKAKGRIVNGTKADDQLLGLQQQAKDQRKEVAQVPELQKLLRDKQGQLGAVPAQKPADMRRGGLPAATPPPAGRPNAPMVAGGARPPKPGAGFPAGPGMPGADGRGFAYYHQALGGGVPGGGFGGAGFGPGGPAAGGGPGGPGGFGGAPGGGAGMPGVGGGGRGWGGGDGYFGYRIYFPAEPPPPPPPAFVLREYAHHRSLGQTGARTDFAETLLWQPVLVLPNGTGKVEFDLCDSVTTFQVTTYGHALDGRIGSGIFTFESKLPFSVEPKIPIEVTASDKIDIPVTVANDTDEKRNVRLNVNVTGMKLAGNADQAFAVDANKRTRKTFRLEPTLVEGQAELALAGRSEPLSSDTIVRNIKVVPDGFPIVGAHSDLLEKVARKEVVLPESWIKGTMKMSVNVYPSTLADLQKGLEALLREPCGCFEQTSTSNYPNVLTLDYLKEADLAKPEVAARARELLERGYGRLTSYECTNTKKSNAKEGYEWFGGTAPAHEALTAYGLLQFRDMSRVYNVDQAMVERTRTYLMARRDGKGGFERNPRALDTFGRAPDNITNAYIVWALTESGKDDELTKEIDALKAQAKTSKDPYFLALVANILINRSMHQEGTELLKKLVEAQKEDGHLDAASTSITGSGGKSLQIETTSLALLAWLKSNQPEFQLAANKAVKWIGQQRSGAGGFGSTQSTILALKALIAHTRANKKTAEAGSLKLFVGNQEAARLDFPAGVQDALTLTLDKADELLKPGKNDVRVEITGKNVFPFTLNWTYQTVKPASAEGCAVKLTTRLDRTAAEEGDTVRLNVAVENVSGKGQGMAVAIIGLPAGLTLPEDFKQLKDYAKVTEDGTKPGKIAAWETRGRELILYWRDLAPNAKIELPIDLICRVPGEYRGPASRAYLYYNADTKHWVDPLQVAIKAR
jgi:hypothetical protein